MANDQHGLIKLRDDLMEQGWTVTAPIPAKSRTDRKKAKTEKPFIVLRLLSPKECAVKYYGKNFILFHERPRRNAKLFKSASALLKHARQRMRAKV